MSDEHRPFRECPECGKSDEYRNIYKHHFFFCDEHRLVWMPGVNLFSSWRGEEDCREAWAKLNGYRTVDGFGEYETGAPLGEQVTFEELLD
jgi:hypothetical protein